MNHRLDTIAADLTETVAGLDPIAQRRVAIAAATFAVERTGLTRPEVTDGLAALRGGAVGDGPVRDSVQRLTDALDQRQWDVQEQVDRGEATTEDHLAAFAGARAANAVLFSFDPDPQAAALEALYEAHAAVDDLAALRTIIADVQ